MRIWFGLILMNMVHTKIHCNIMALPQPLLGEADFLHGQTRPRYQRLHFRGDNKCKFADPFI